MENDLTLVTQFINDNPILVGRVSDTEFGTLFRYPEEVINQYKKSINFLKTSFKFTDEMVQEYCMDYLKDACKHIQDLKDKEAENS